MAIGTPVNLGTQTTQNSAASTIPITTSAAGSGSGRVVAWFVWQGAVTASSVSGGGLTWTIDKQVAGFAVCSAAAPSGWTSGTVITLTLSGASTSSGSGAAMFLPGAETGASFIDGTPAGATGTGTTWLMGSVTIAFADSIVIGAVFGDTTSGPANTPTGSPLGTEVHDNYNSGFGVDLATEYLLPGATGAYNLGGTFNFARSIGAQLGIAYRAAASTTVQASPLLAMYQRGGLQRAWALMRLHPPQVVAPASYNQTLTATVTSTATLQNQVGKIVTATATSTATLVKQVAKTGTATATSSAALIKSVGKTLTATVTGTASLAALKVVLKTLTATSTVTATVVKQVGKPLSSTVTATASLVRQVAKSLTVTITATASLSALKVILKTLTATLAASASMARQVGKPMTVTVTATASVIRQVGKLLTKTVTATPSLSALKVTLKTLTATVTGTATLVRATGKTLTATVAMAASVTKRIGKTITGLVSGVASLVGIRVGPDTADPNPIRIVFTESGSVTFREPRSLSHVEPDRTVAHTEAGSLVVIEQGSIVHRDRR